MDATAKLPPWEQHSPDDPPQYTVSIKINAYYLEQLRYLVACTELSQNKLMKRMVLPVLEKKAIAQYEQQQ